MNRYGIPINLECVVYTNATSLIGAEIQAKHEINTLLYELISIGRKSKINGSIELKITPEQYKENLEKRIKDETWKDEVMTFVRKNLEIKYL